MRKFRVVTVNVHNPGDLQEALDKAIREIYEETLVTSNDISNERPFPGFYDDVDITVASHTTIILPGATPICNTIILQLDYSHSDRGSY